MVTEVAPLSIDALYRACDPESLGFDSTDELEPLSHALGQERARSAITRGVGISAQGYNIFALGSAYLEKRAAVHKILQESSRDPRAPATPAQYDWVYLDNLKDRRQPLLLRLPVGLGTELREQMDQFCGDVLSSLAVLFEDEGFQARAQALTAEFQKEQKEALLVLQQEAAEAGLRMLQTAEGFAFAPLDEAGEAMDTAAFNALDEARQKAIGETIEAFNERLMILMQKLPQRQQSLAREQKSLAEDRAANVLRELARPVQRRFHEFPAVMGFLNEVIVDIVAQLPRLVALENSADPRLEMLMRRYRVNPVVCRASGEDADLTIVYESNPTVENLLGRVTQQPSTEGMQVDASMISVGSVQRANGGYLLIDAERLLARPMAWDALKRALVDRLARIEAASQAVGFGYGFAIEPQPMPLDVKVVLLGSRLIYYMLCAQDPDFEQLFKIAAEFEDDVAASSELLHSFARMVAGLTREANLLPVSADGVARIIEYAQRIASYRDRVSAHSVTIRDLLVEADFEARAADEPLIDRKAVAQAITDREARLARSREQTLDSIARDIVLIETSGRQVGQINGLSVLQIGSFSFGQPSRLTANVRPGVGRLVDIERESNLGGNIHSKGVLIVSSWLGACFAQRGPLSLHASIVFEQSYGGVDGDSASIAEVCVLLSAISRIPLRQGLAVTGSMNQHGMVQAIGGVNEKIEGFFSVCKARGFDDSEGPQGVIIPQANLHQLMLREEVRTAVADGKFQIFAVAHVAEAVALFTGLPLGEADDDGQFAEATVGAAVAERLAGFSAARRAGFPAATGEADDDESATEEQAEDGDDSQHSSASVDSQR